MAFDRADVIDRAVEVFWTSGFDGASLDDLVGNVGISRSTLYNSFGGKDGLHATALEHYLGQVERTVIDPLRNGSGGIADLLAFVDRVEHVLTSPDMPAGCLVLNEMAAPRNGVAVERYLSSMRSAIADAFRRAVMHGEVGESIVDARCAVVLAAVIGANHAAHSAVQPDATELLGGLRAVIEEWRLSDAS